MRPTTPLHLPWLRLTSQKGHGGPAKRSKIANSSATCVSKASYRGWHSSVSGLTVVREHKLRRLELEDRRRKDTSSSGPSIGLSTGESGRISSTAVGTRIPPLEM
eukprot:TRINITY_DN7315_c0_g1_i4.p1 TRINITY_DN7315_c0_g1~~TRINITY_DN7315_c0_g1_i4.p1  ORF type:complete len:105 (-),score=1.29 TRINITY_DN7315_c0_g1_i4:178-492(-)